VRLGEPHNRPVELPAGSYVEFRLEPVGGEAAVTLLDAQERPVAQSSLHGRRPQTLAAVANSPGPYVLRIQTEVEEEVRVQVTLVDQRNSSPADEVLLAALAEWQEALKLKAEQTEESTRRGITLMASAADRLAGTHFKLHEGRIRRELGDCYSTTGFGEMAEAEYLRAIELLESGGDPIALAEALNSHADLLTNRGEGEPAEPLYDRALGLAIRAGDLRVQALTWNNLGVLYYHRGELDRVVEAFQKALDLQLASGADYERANTLGNLGSVYRALGRYGEALRVSDYALALARQLDDKQRELGILNSRGVCLKAVGNLRGATDAYQEALELVDLLGARDMEATVAGNLGSLYRLLGQQDRAREFLERSLVSAVSVGSESDQSWALLALGEVAREAGDERAVDYYRRAAELAEASGDGFSAGHSLLGLGRAHLDMERPLQAVDALSRALALQERLSDRPGEVATLRELARAQGVLGHSKAARDNFERSLELAQLVREPSKEAQTRFRYAEFLLEQGELTASWQQASAAGELIEELRKSVVQPDLRAGLLSRSHQDFALLVEVLARLEQESPGQGYAEEAFAVAERARARALVEYLTEAQAKLAADIPPEFRIELDDFAGRLSRSQQKLTRSLRQPTIDPASVEALQDEIETLNRKRADLWREIRLADPRWASLQYPEPLNLQRTRRLLGEGQVLISFMLGERQSHVFLVSAQDFALGVLPSESELTPLIEEVGGYLEVPARRSVGRFQLASRGLYEMLLGALEAKTVDYDHLLIAADGALHYLPFEALVTGEPGAGVASYLISNWAVSYVPSASAIEALANHRTTRSPGDKVELAAFADPLLGATASPLARELGETETWAWRELVGARDEVAAISGFFEPSRTRVFVGAEASEESFRASAEVRGARYLHVASHALIDNQRPGLSALLLGADQGGGYDGLLQTHEVFDLELSADLVVLSGCETALGRAVRGEGLVGFTRAFLYAGADAVSVSLWPIEDRSTASLMTGFYRELNLGMPVVQALRRAKLEQAGTAATSHPYYWASFVLIGAPS